MGTRRIGCSLQERRDPLGEALKELMEDDHRDLPGLPPEPRRGPSHREHLDLHARRAERDARRRERREQRAERREARFGDPPAGASSRSRRQKLTPEERAYREARRVANAKMAFVIHFVTYGMVCLFLLLVAGFRAAFTVGFFWGLALALHYVAAVMGPGLRRRWIDQEVARQVSRTTTRQRRELVGEHARDLEELSASIAHEIRNPITAAKSLVQQMGEDPNAHENVEYAGVALEELDRVERSISHLLRFARDEDVEAREMHMADVVDSALETLRDRIERLGVKVSRRIDGACAMVGDPEKLRRVVINLFANALDAMAEAHTPAPRIDVQAGENLAGSEVWVRVRDNGPGIEPERMNKIFSPFYTSKAAGTGLGLALSKKVVDAHGGCIAVESSPANAGGGTEFLLTLPKQPPEPQDGGRRS